MRVFTSKTSKKNGMYHILFEERTIINLNYFRSLCGNAHPEGFKYAEGCPDGSIEYYSGYKHSKKLCPICVGMAYKLGIIKVKENK